METAQEKECKNSPYGVHCWWTYTWSNLSAGGELKIENRCLYCGALRKDSERAIEGEKEDGEQAAR